MRNWLQISLLEYWMKNGKRLELIVLLFGLKEGRENEGFGGGKMLLIACSGGEGRGMKNVCWEITQTF